MVYKSYIFLNILFIFGLFLYFITFNFSIDFQDIFYLFFSLFGMIVPATIYLNGYIYKDREEEKSYKFLFLGFFIYGLANLIWYLNEILMLEISINYLNLLFIFQIFTKHYFLKYLNFNREGLSFFKVFNTIFSINVLILLISMFVGFYINLNSFIFDLYYVLYN